MKTVHIATELPTEVERVWAAMQYPVTFLYVCRGLFGLPALAGRGEPLHEGESGSGWLWALHLIPAYRHHISIVGVDAAEHTITTEEHGGLLRAWNHTLKVEPISASRCRYSDTVDIEAGALTGLVCVIATGMYRYRQRRWHKLVVKHLLLTGPAFAGR